MRRNTAVALLDLDPMQGRAETPSSRVGEPTARAVIDRAAGTVTTWVDVACPPERVYRMLVTAETERWWGSTETYVMRDWCVELRPGGSWRVLVCFPDGRRLPASGNFLELDLPEKVVQTRRYEFDHPTLGRRETRVSYLFTRRMTGARVTVFHEGFAGLEAAAVEHALGWERVLSWLEPYARRVNEEERRRQ
jgi:uncharacterized protein YndB with AHSA1/START domain